MANITFHEQPAHTAGNLPEVGSTAANFTCVTNELKEVALADFKGKKVLLNIFPCVSKDLPFALGRFCAAEGIDNLVMASDFRGDFSAHYPVTFTDSPLKGLLSRCVIVVDEQGKVVYTEQVAETTSEPNYEKALAALSK